MLRPIVIAAAALLMGAGVYGPAAAAEGQSAPKQKTSAATKAVSEVTAQRRARGHRHVRGRTAYRPYRYGYRRALYRPYRHAYYGGYYNRSFDRPYAFGYRPYSAFAYGYNPWVSYASYGFPYGYNLWGRPGWYPYNRFGYGRWGGWGPGFGFRVGPVGFGVW